MGFDTCTAEMRAGARIIFAVVTIVIDVGGVMGGVRALEHQGVLLVVGRLEIDWVAIGVYGAVGGFVFAEAGVEVHGGGMREVF